MTAARRPGLVAMAAAVMLLVAAPVALPVVGRATGLAALEAAGPAVARGAAPDLSLVTEAVYTIRPDEARVQVSVGIDARNTTDETRTRRYYFDHAFLAVQPGAANPRLTGTRGARVVVIKRTHQSTLLRLNFGERLYSGKRVALRLAFDLPGGGRAPSPQVRVGDALVTVPVWAFASNGARGSTVAVRFPGGWDVAVESGRLERRAESGGGVVLESGPIEEPLRFFAYVTAQRPAAFDTRSVTLDVAGQPAPLELHGWRDDPAWSKRVESLFRGALPVLREDIGLGWPMDAPLAISESVSRDADASAGVFDPATGRVELAYWADAPLIVHQAAHGWFNGTLLADRWANEGFATFYALRAADRLHLDASPPRLTAPARAAALPLATWQGGEGALTPADTYAYATAYEVASQLADRVGLEALRATWADAAAGTGAYQPPVAALGAAASDAAATAPAPGTPEGVAGPPDWRSLLDLLEAHSGQDLTDLWRALVVPPESAPLLDARDAARAAYTQTLALAGQWALPRPVRDALRAWDFPTAQRLLGDARTVLAQRNAILATASRDGLVVPDTMRTLFESGTLAEASARGAAETAALDAIGRAEAARSSRTDPLSQLGMLGEHPEVDLSIARAAFMKGDLDGAQASAGRAWRAWTNGWQEGRRRALVALAALAAVLVLGSAWIAQRQRVRRAAEIGGLIDDDLEPVVVGLFPAPGGTASAAPHEAPRQLDLGLAGIEPVDRTPASTPTPPPLDGGVTTA